MFHADGETDRNDEDHSRFSQFCEKRLKSCVASNVLAVKFNEKLLISIQWPLWSSGQSFWLQIQRSRVRSPVLPDFLSSSGSGTGSAQPREVKLRSYLNKKSSGSRFRKQRLTAVGTRCANHVTPLYPQKLALTSPTGGGRSVGMVRSRTKATEFRSSLNCTWK